MKPFDLKNSSGPCCSRDAEGDLSTPEHGPILEGLNGIKFAAPVVNPGEPLPAPPTSGDNTPPSAPQPMQNDEGNGNLVTPPDESFDNDAFRGSMQQILSDNIGQFVVCEFIIGTSGMTTKEGILYAVGRAYVVLYEELSRTYVVCDIFSIKFVTFYLPGERPRRNSASSTSGMRPRR